MPKVGSIVPSALEPIKAPFPWFGGKSRVAPLVWDWFGQVDNYVEPFFGSGAVLLGSPRIHRTETINDADGFVANFWRATKHDPEAVAFHADNPVNENDLHARHVWLLERRETLTAKLEGDPEYFDAKIAGWWCWGSCCWIGSGFCSGNGPWQAVDMPDGTRQLVHLGDAGQGVNRQLVHLGDAGRGVNRKRVHLGDAGNEVANRDGVIGWMLALAQRLNRVRVCCGDWKRVCGPTPTVKQGLTAVFLDPPYADEAKRTKDLYAKDCGDVANEVREWAIANGDDKRLRIAVCGYEGEHTFPESWNCVAWKASGGYGSQGKASGQSNAYRELIWFSPHCLCSETPEQKQQSDFLKKLAAVKKMEQVCPK